MAPAPKTVAEFEDAVSKKIRSDDIWPLMDRYVKAQQAFIKLQGKYLHLPYENHETLAAPAVGFDPYSPPMSVFETGFHDGLMLALALDNATGPFSKLPEKAQHEIYNAREEVDISREFVVALTRTEARKLAREAVQPQKDYDDLLHDVQSTGRGKADLKEAERLLGENTAGDKSSAPKDARPSSKALQLVLEARLIGHVYDDINMEADAPFAKRRALIAGAVAEIKNQFKDDPDYKNAQAALKKEWDSGRHTFVEHLSANGDDHVPFLKETQDALGKVLEKAKTIVKEKKLLKEDEQENVEDDVKEVIKQIRRNLVMPENIPPPTEHIIMKEPADDRLRQLAALASTPGYEPATPEGYRPSSTGKVFTPRGKDTPHQA